MAIIFENFKCFLLLFFLLIIYFGPLPESSNFSKIFLDDKIKRHRIDFFKSLFGGKCQKKFGKIFSESYSTQKIKYSHRTPFYSQKIKSTTNWAEIYETICLFLFKNAKFLKVYYLLFRAALSEYSQKIYLIILMRILARW